MFDLSGISKMNYKELRNAVQELYDSYIKLKRLVEDSLDNIDESNLATAFRKKLNNHASTLKITAESIESRVSYEDLENNLSKYSTIQQTAEQISATVAQNQEYTDGTAEKLSSSFTMTADRISTNVVKVKLDTTRLYSSVNQTAEALESIVGKDIKARFEKDVMPTEKNTTDVEKEKICKYGGRLYYFNQITQSWREYTEGGVNSAFKQTADGFELNGCVSISGDLITSGTITGTDIQGGQFYNANKTTRLELGMDGNLGDLRLYRVSGDKEIFAVFDNGTNVLLKAFEHPILSVGETRTVRPSGTWDFSSCNVVGLPQSVSE